MVDAAQRRVELIHVGPHENAHLQLRPRRVGRAPSDVNRGARVAREDELNGSDAGQHPSGGPVHGGDGAGGPGSFAGAGRSKKASGTAQDPIAHATIWEPDE